MDVTLLVVMLAAAGAALVVVVARRLQLAERVRADAPRLGTAFLVLWGGLLVTLAIATFVPDQALPLYLVVTALATAGLQSARDRQRRAQGLSTSPLRRWLIDTEVILAAVVLLLVAFGRW